MFKFLDKYFLREFFYVYFFVILIFFPFVFLADFVISGSFHFYLACSKVLFRYGQMLPLILLVSSYLATSHILYKNNLVFFLQLGCNKFIVLKALVISWLFCSLAYYLIIIPSNQLFFPRTLASTKWIILRIDNDQTLFVHQNNDKKYDIFPYSKNSDEIFRKTQENLYFSEDNFYITWNDVRKLGYYDLNNYERYLKKNNWSTDDIRKQRLIYIYRFFLLFVMLICGYVFALKRSLFSLFISFLLSNWVDIIAFYLKLKYCILILCVNLSLWVVVSLFHLYY